MKLVAVDHNAVFRAYRRRYGELARLAGTDVTVVAPEYLDLPHGRQPLQPWGADERFSLIAARPVGTFKSHRGFLDPRPLVQAFREAPDLIFLEAEPEAWHVAECLALRRRTTPRSKVVLTTWSNLNLYATGFPYRPAFLYRWTYRRALAQADGVLCYASACEAILRANAFRGATRKVGWGVNTQVFARVRGDAVRTKLALRPFTVGYCGRLVEEKGLLVLLDAVARLDRRDAGVLIIGDGPMRTALPALAASRGIHLTLIAPVDNHELPAYYSAMDVLVLPSLTTRFWKEQFGRVLIEAMACSVPVVGSSSGEIPHVIGDAGLVFAEGQADGLRACLRRIADDQALRQQLAAAGRARVEAAFTWEHAAADMHHFFTGLLGR